MQVTKTCCLIANVSHFLPARLFSDCFHAALSLQDSCFLSATAAVRVLHFYSPSGPPDSVQHHSPLVSMSINSQWIMCFFSFITNTLPPASPRDEKKLKMLFVRKRFLYMFLLEWSQLRLIWPHLTPVTHYRPKQKLCSTILLFTRVSPPEWLRMSHMFQLLQTPCFSR